MGAVFTAARMAQAAADHLTGAEGQENSRVAQDGREAA